MDIDAKAREMVQFRGGICLVGPGVTSHERTFCDCTVERMLAAAMLAVRNEAIEEAVKAAESVGSDWMNDDQESGWRAAESAIVEALRRMKDTTR